VSRYRQGLVVGKFAPLHVGHQQLLDHAHELADEVTVIVWSNPDFDIMPNEVRAGWVRTLYPEACVLVGHDGPPNDAPDDAQRNTPQSSWPDTGESPTW
jgi:HTH-type transcriptional regulator, transcriptional repressor of NAD biosynthesis genes